MKPRLDRDTETPRADTGPPPGSVVVFGSIWLSLIVAGAVAMHLYSSSPGSPPAAPTHWPAASGLPPLAGSQVLLFLHPQCPCSSATLRQLERALGSSPADHNVRVVALDPGQPPADWDPGRAARRVEFLKGASLFMDRDGIETRRFGVTTSGHVLAYDARGELVFSGGITPGRGHEGACAGSHSLISILRGEAPRAGQSPVFGCPIFGSSAGCRAGDKPCH